MIQRVDAIFENGVFRPEQPVHVPDGQRVSLSIETPVDSADDLSDITDLLDHDFMEFCKTHVAPPGLSEARAILSKFKGSLADFISEERSER
ncbi:MAG: antitoxin family protein [Pirellulales bacterium]|nr:antitoxin family protein [Pirellulales bacterium]